MLKRSILGMFIMLMLTSLAFAETPATTTAATQTTAMTQASPSVKKVKRVKKSVIPAPKKKVS